MDEYSRHKLADSLFENPARLLRAIRDGEIKSYADLDKFNEEGTLQLHDAITHRVGELIREGIVVETNSGFELSEPFKKLRAILNISLDELSRKPNKAIWVDPHFQLRELHIEPLDVFILMPFAEKLQPVYEDHIKSVVSALGLTTGRADDFFNTHVVVDDIWTGIYSSNVVVADCTGRNPNVFYEIGIAHTLGKPVILISQDIEDIPFDIQHYRCIVYELTPRGMTSFEETLRNTLQHYVSSDE